MLSLAWQRWNDPLVISRVEPGRRHVALAMVRAEDDAQDGTPRFRFEAFKGRLRWLIQLLERVAKLRSIAGSIAPVAHAWFSAEASQLRKVSKLGGIFQTRKLQKEPPLPHNGNQLEKQ